MRYRSALACGGAIGADIKAVLIYHLKQVE